MVAGGNQSWYYEKDRLKGDGAICGSCEIDYISQHTHKPNNIFTKGRGEKADERVVAVSIGDSFDDSRRSDVPEKCSRI